MVRVSSLRFGSAIVIASTLLFCAARTCAQDSQSQQDQAIVEAARKARAKKKTEKPLKVIDDDALKPSPGSTNPPDLQTAKAAVPTIPGEAAPTTAAEGASENKEKAEAPTAETAPSEQKSDQKEEAKELAAEVAKAKVKLEDLQKQQDLLQREVALDKDSLYSKPDYAHDTAGKAKLDALQQQVSGKQQEVSNAKARLEELQSKLAQVAPPQQP